MKNIVRTRTPADVCRRAALASSFVALALSVAHAQAPDSAFGRNRGPGAFGGAVKATPNAPTVVNPNQRPAQATITPIQRTITETPATSSPSANQPGPSTQSALKITPSVGSADPQAANINMKIVLSSQTLTSSSPHKANLVSSQRSLLAEQNAAAQSARGKAIAGAAAAQATTPPARTLQQSSVSHVGAFGHSPALANQHIAKNAWHPTPGIYLANGKARGFTVTPGGYLTIAGYGLGENAGEVGLFGSTTRTKLTLQVATWSDGEISALLPVGLRGLPDQEMKLQVITHEGKIYFLEGARFYAAREEVTLTSQFDRLYRVEAGGWTPTSILPDGGVQRLDTGNSIDCARPGADRLVFLPLASQFQVSGVAMVHDGRTDSGDGDGDGHAGNHTFSPGYSFGEWRDEPVAVDRLRSSTQSVLYLNWGVMRSHTSGASFGGDRCWSYYRITAVTVVGPAGVAPL